MAYAIIDLSPEDGLEHPVVDENGDHIPFETVEAAEAYIQDNGLSHWQITVIAETIEKNPVTRLEDALVDGSNSPT